MKLSNPYDFYSMKKQQRCSLIGSYFTIKGKESTDYIKFYFPVILDEQSKWMNYGVKQGIIVIAYSPLNIAIFAFSPDDLDLGIYYKNTKKSDFKLMVEYIKNANKINVNYIDFLKNFFNIFPQGEKDGF